MYMTRTPPAVAQCNLFNQPKPQAMKYSTSLQPGFLVPIPEMEKPDYEINEMNNMNVPPPEYYDYQKYMASLPPKIKCAGDWSNMPETVEGKDFEIKYELLSPFNNIWITVSEERYEKTGATEKRIVAYPLPLKKDKVKWAFDKVEVEPVDTEQEQNKSDMKEWIKASDKLPEDNQRILFVDDHNGIRLGSFLKKDQWDRENMFCDGAFFNVSKVAAWMPRPKYPVLESKESEQDELWDEIIFLILEGNSNGKNFKKLKQLFTITKK